MADRSFTNPYHAGLREHGLDAPTVDNAPGPPNHAFPLQTCDCMGESAGGVAHVESQIGHSHRSIRRAMKAAQDLIVIVTDSSVVPELAVEGIE
ncbi:MAG: hypothetical protein WAM81_11445 [Acidimicrobiia bacterium]